MKHKTQNMIIHHEICKENEAKRIRIRWHNRRNTDDASNVNSISYICVCHHLVYHKICSVLHNEQKKGISFTGSLRHFYPLVKRLI